MAVTGRPRSHLEHNKCSVSLTMREGSTLLFDALNNTVSTLCMLGSVHVCEQCCELDCSAIALSWLWMCLGLSLVDFWNCRRWLSRVNTQRYRCHQSEEARSRPGVCITKGLAYVHLNYPQQWNLKLTCHMVVPFMSNVVCCYCRSQ